MDKEFWSFCEDMKCLSLFNDDCPGKDVCERRRKAKDGIQIFFVVKDEERYVATLGRKH